MKMPDVNVLVDAWNDASPFHGRARDWLEDSLNDGETIAIADAVLSGSIRILTSRRIPGMAWPIAEVIDVANALLAQPGVMRMHPGDASWPIFTDLCGALRAEGNFVPDCYLAALAIERDAVLVSRDAFFGRVPGLNWSDLPG